MDALAMLSQHLPPEGHEGALTWGLQKGLVPLPHDALTVWKNGIRVAVLLGPDRYDQLARLLATEPKRED
jgi:hypothetical protein